jgi:hypothetical protein
MFIRVMDEDLLVTNAFYPIAVLTEQNNKQSTRVDYNYNRPIEQPYKTEQLGPYPNISLKREKKYDVKTASDFKQYLKKKEKVGEPFNTNTNAEYMDTMMERGNLPQFFNEQTDRRLKIKKITMNFDSRSRDLDLYPNAYDYILPVPYKIENIKYVELISSELIFKPVVIYPYIFMCSKVLTEIEKFNSVGHIFTKIQLRSPDVPETFLFDGHIKPSLTIFSNTPLQQLNQLDFQFKFPDGSWYDIGEHSFTLEFTVYIDTISNSNISSRRGIQDKTNLESNLML